MRRTEGRPLPSGRVQPEEAYRFGVALSVVGVLILALRVNALVAFLAAATCVLYVLFYTPLKQRTRWNTAVGAVAGALPPVGGWAASQGTLGLEAGLLFAIMFIWQFPHFYSIAWIYREDYARGGFRMISGDDPDGLRTSRHVLGWSWILIPVSLLPGILGYSGGLYLGASLALTLALLVFGYSFARIRGETQARHLMRATLVYLPALWFVLLLDRFVV